MSNILVYLQQSKGALPKSSLTAITAAQQLRTAWKKERIIALILGDGSAAAAALAAGYGVDKVLFLDSVATHQPLARHYSSAILHVVAAEGCDTVVASATSIGKDVLPRVAAALEAGQASEITAIDSDGRLHRPMYAGNVIAAVSIETVAKVVTVRQTAFAPATASGAAAPVEAVGGWSAPDGHDEFISYEVSASERPELSDASIVVSGGRALQSAENFEKVIFPLADALGAAVGASRAAVDSGYAPNDWQVGQTGKVVAPQLYIAAGISGAIQHLAGMKDSKVIVAINKDAEAPIYEIADFGLVADLFQAVPELTEAVKRVKS